MDGGSLQSSDANLSSQAAESSTVEGALRSVEKGVVYGWAWDPSDVKKAIEVEVFAEGFLLGRGSANHRSDLQPANVSGAHSFAISLEPSRQLFAPYEIWAQVAGGNKPLGNPLSIVSSEMHETDVVPFAGRITGVSAGAIEGWIVRKADPGSPQHVDLSIGREIVTMEMASDPEPNAPSFGNGHGFRLSIPPSYLNGGVHTARVLVSGTKFELDGSPFPFALLPMSVVSDRLSRLERIAEELQRDKEKHIYAIKELYLDVGRDLAQRLDAMINIQRRSFEEELSFLRREIGNEPPEFAEGVSDPATHRMVLDDNFTGYGWHSSELDPSGRPFRWMANKSTIVFDHRGDSAHINIEGYQILDPGNIECVNVNVNGVPLPTKAKLGDNDSWSLDSPIPALALRGNLFAVVTIEADFARHPGPGDPRELSVSVRSVTISPGEGPQRGRRKSA